MLDVDGFSKHVSVQQLLLLSLIELAYIHCAIKENFSVTLTKKGFTCLICRELLVRSVKPPNIMRRFMEDV